MFNITQLITALHHTYYTLPNCPNNPIIHTISRQIDFSNKFNSTLPYTQKVRTGQPECKGSQLDHVG